MKKKYVRIGIHHFAIDVEKGRLYEATIEGDSCQVRVIQKRKEIEWVENAGRDKVEITEKEFTANLTKAVKMIQSQCLGLLDEQLAKKLQKIDHETNPQQPIR